MAATPVFRSPLPRLTRRFFFFFLSFFPPVVWGKEKEDVVGCGLPPAEGCGGILWEVTRGGLWWWWPSISASCSPSSMEEKEEKEVVEREASSVPSEEEEGRWTPSVALSREEGPSRAYTVVGERPWAYSISSRALPSSTPVDVPSSPMEAACGTTAFATGHGTRGSPRTSNDIMANGEGM